MEKGVAEVRSGVSVCLPGGGGGGREGKLLSAAACRPGLLLFLPFINTKGFCWMLCM